MEIIPLIKIKQGAGIDSRVVILTEMNKEGLYENMTLGHCPKEVRRQTTLPPDISEEYLKKRENMKTCVSEKE